MSCFNPGSRKKKPQWFKVPCIQQVFNPYYRLGMTKWPLQKFWKLRKKKTLGCVLHSTVMNTTGKTTKQLEVSKVLAEGDTVFSPYWDCSQPLPPRSAVPTQCPGGWAPTELPGSPLPSLAVTRCVLSAQTSPAQGKAKAKRLWGSTHVLDMLRVGRPFATKYFGGQFGNMDEKP